MDLKTVKHNFDLLSMHLSKSNEAIGDLVSKTERLEQRLLIIRKEFDVLSRRFERDQKDVWKSIADITDHIKLKDKKKE